MNERDIIEAKLMQTTGGSSWFSSTCTNPRHYPTAGPPENALTSDPRLHWPDDSPCVYEAPDEAPDAP